MLLKAPPGLQARRDADIRLALALALVRERRQANRRDLDDTARRLTQTEVCWPSSSLFQVGSRMELRGGSSLGP